MVRVSPPLRPIIKKGLGKVMDIANQAAKTGTLSLPRPLQGHVEAFTSPSPFLGRCVLPEK